VAFFVCGFGMQSAKKVSAFWACDELAMDGGTGNYLISTPKDLSDMACWVNNGDANHRDGIYDLQNDIDLTGVEWVPIGTAFYPFTGEFKGHYFKIKNLTITTMAFHNGDYLGYGLYGAGFFGYVSSASIIDLRFSDPSLNIITNNVTAVDTDEYHISLAGIVAAAADGSSMIHDVDVSNGSITVSNEENLIQMNSFLYAIIGGLVGRLGPGAAIQDSSLTGGLDITVAEEDAQYVYMGGLVGTAEEANISHSWFMGDITFESPAGYQLNELTVGGIVGSSLGSAMVSDIVGMSSIDVISDTTYAAIGGLVGSADVYSAFVGSTVHGEFTTTTNNLGGLIGYVGSGETNPAGMINLFGTSKPQEDASINLDTNNVMATLMGRDNVGGLIGKLEVNTNIFYSWFDGSIDGRRCVGGMVGGAYESMVRIWTSFSVGDLNGHNYLGGIVGYGLSGNELTDVFSRVNITLYEDTDPVPVGLSLVDYYVAGLIGFDYGVMSTYAKTYYAGTIDVGSIVVSNFDPISNFINEPISITFTYFDHDLLPMDSLLGSPKTTAQMMVSDNYEGFVFDSPWYIDPVFNAGYAYFTAGYYRVTFDDGSDPYGFLVRYESPLLEPEDPVQTGFVFGGWFTDPTHTVPWDFASDEVTEDVVLYALWTEAIPDTGESNDMSFVYLGLGVLFFGLSRKTRKQA